jgi:hypothetical protein
VGMDLPRVTTRPPYSLISGGLTSQWVLHEFQDTNKVVLVHVDGAEIDGKEVIMQFY